MVYEDLLAGFTRAHDVSNMCSLQVLPSTGFEYDLSGG